MNFQPMPTVSCNLAIPSTSGSHFEKWGELYLSCRVQIATLSIQRQLLLPGARNETEWVNSDHNLLNHLQLMAQL